MHSNDIIQWLFNRVFKQLGLTFRIYFTLWLEISNCNSSIAIKLVYFNLIYLCMSREINSCNLSACAKSQDLLQSLQKFLVDTRGMVIIGGKMVHDGMVDNIHQLTLINLNWSQYPPTIYLHVDCSLCSTFQIILNNFN